MTALALLNASMWKVRPVPAGIPWTKALQASLLVRSLLVRSVTMGVKVGVPVPGPTVRVIFTIEVAVAAVLTVTPIFAAPVGFSFEQLTPMAASVIAVTTARFLFIQSIMVWVSID